MLKAKIRDAANTDSRFERLAHGGPEPDSRSRPGPSNPCSVRRGADKELRVGAGRGADSKSFRNRFASDDWQLRAGKIRSGSRLVLLERVEGIERKGHDLCSLGQRDVEQRIAFMHQRQVRAPDNDPVRG